MHEQGYHITNLSFQASNVNDANIDSIVPVADVGERLILNHLVELGHRRIGYIYGVANREILSDRLTTCLTIQQELGLPIRDEWVRLCDPTPARSYEATAALINDCRGHEHPTTLIVVNDLLATGVLAALNTEHIRVPEQMSVASFDNAPIAPYTVPSLTTVDYDAYMMGTNAARLTIERLAEPERPSVCIEAPARLVVRRSTGLCQVEDFL
jgi:LacI family transcriptional regulator